MGDQFPKEIAAIKIDNVSTKKEVSPIKGIEDEIYQREYNIDHIDDDADDSNSYEASSSVLALEELDKVECLEVREKHFNTQTTSLGKSLAEVDLRAEGSFRESSNILFDEDAIDFDMIAPSMRNYKINKYNILDSLAEIRFSDHL